MNHRGQFYGSNVQLACFASLHFRKVGGDACLPLVEQSLNLVVPADEFARYRG
jgi:hypothetical protein